MKQQSFLSETGGQKEAFECLKAGCITLRYLSQPQALGERS